jgi:hypothetical protein
MLDTRTAFLPISVTWIDKFLLIYPFLGPDWSSLSLNTDSYRPFIGFLVVPFYSLCEMLTAFSLMVSCLAYSCKLKMMNVVVLRVLVNYSTIQTGRWLFPPYIVLICVEIHGR